MVTVARAEESNGRGKYRNAKKGNSNLVIVTLCEFMYVCMNVKLHVYVCMYVHQCMSCNVWYMYESYVCTVHMYTYSTSYRLYIIHIHVCSIHTYIYILHVHVVLCTIIGVPQAKPYRVFLDESKITIFTSY